MNPKVKITVPNKYNKVDFPDIVHESEEDLKVIRSNCR